MTVRVASQIFHPAAEHAVAFFVPPRAHRQRPGRGTSGAQFLAVLPVPPGVLAVGAASFLPSAPFLAWWSALGSGLVGALAASNFLPSTVRPSCENVSADF